MITVLGKKITNPIVWTNCAEHSALYGTYSKAFRRQNTQTQHDQTTQKDHFGRFQQSK